jgi:hypothetical protein
VPKLVLLVLLLPDLLLLHSVAVLQHGVSDGEPGVDPAGARGYNSEHPLGNGLDVDPLDGELRGQFATGNRRRTNRTEGPSWTARPSAIGGYLPKCENKRAKRWPEATRPATFRRHDTNARTNIDAISECLKLANSCRFENLQSSVRPIHLTQQFSTAVGNVNYTLP